jgi:hypothetical protein
MRVVLALCLTLAATTTIEAQRADLIRVYVVPATSDSGFVDPRLADSRADLLNFFRRFEKKRVVVVESAEAADLSVEILSSSHEVTGEETTGRVGRTTYSANTHASTAPIVRVLLRAGTHEAVMTGAGVNWRTSAVYAGAEIRKWIKANREQLIAKRAQ